MLLTKSRNRVRANAGKRYQRVFLNALSLHPAIGGYATD